jgi:hypothetical protein
MTGIRFLGGTVTFFPWPSDGGRLRPLRIYCAMDIGGFFPGGKVAEREALQMRPCSAEVKNYVLCSTSLPLTF